jgi:hypothetical protein
MVVPPIKISRSVLSLLYSLATQIMDRHTESSQSTSRSTLGAESPMSRRSTSSERYGQESVHLIPGTNLYATPWDANAPDQKGHEYIRSPLLPPKPKRPGGDSDEELALNSLEGSPMPNDNFETKKVRFPRTLSGTTFNPDEQRSILFEESESIPNSAKSRTHFFASSMPRSTLWDRRNSNLWVPAKHPWWPHIFESILWRPLLTLFITVVISYPVLWVTVFAATGWSLFWTRFIVGFSTSVLGE